jgi:hypothetical protein
MLIMIAADVVLVALALVVGVLVGGVANAVVVDLHFTQEEKGQVGHGKIARKNRRLLQS